MPVKTPFETYLKLLYKDYFIKGTAETDYSYLVDLEYASEEYDYIWTILTVAIIVIILIAAVAVIVFFVIGEKNRTNGNKK